MRVLVLGAGKMTEAILMGLREKENLSQWMIYSPSGVSAQKLAGKVGAKAIINLSDAKNPDWILVGCKPQQLKDLAQTLDEKLKGCLFVSMLAALSEELQLKILGVKELIRIMPNLPVQYGEGVTLLSSISAETRLPSFQVLFSKLGTSIAMKEEELEELTLLTGSGPAFFYEFASLFAQSFNSLDMKEREKLVRQVLKGAALSASQAEQSLSEMRESVTSKGGVTIAVLNEWWNLNFAEFLKKGVAAGKKRAAEIKSLLQS